MTWLNNYANALAKSSAKFTPTSITVKAGNYGPVPVIITAELAIASNGSLDGYFQGSQQQLSTNTTPATMFFSDGTLWETIAEAQGVGGDQWGVMNELWNFPGQVWLWLYSGMYQIPALNPSNNANLDLDVGLLMILFGFLLPMFAPWIPVINRIPRWIPLYKIIYRQYYANMAGGQQPPTELQGEPAPPPPAPRDGVTDARMTLTTPSGLNGPVSVLSAPVSAAAAGTYTIKVGAARATVTRRARDPGPGCSPAPVPLAGGRPAGDCCAAARPGAGKPAPCRSWPDAGRRPRRTRPRPPPLRRFRRAGGSRRARRRSSSQVPSRGDHDGLDVTGLTQAGARARPVRPRRLANAA